MRLAILLIALCLSPAHSKDLEGKYAQSPNHDWVKGLHSKTGAWCCDITDGRALVDADWRSFEGHYQVKYQDMWLDVPESSVITEPNRLGQTIVWFYFNNGVPSVTCFLPGVMM
jgi:hypothetical protein